MLNILKKFNIIYLLVHFFDINLLSGRYRTFLISSSLQLLYVEYGNIHAECQLQKLLYVPYLSTN